MHEKYTLGKSLLNYYYIIMKQRMFKFFSDEIINNPDLYITEEGGKEILDFKSLAEEAQSHFDYHSDIVHEWVLDWYQHILRLTPDNKS